MLYTATQSDKHSECDYKFIKLLFGFQNSNHFAQNNLSKERSALSIWYLFIYLEKKK